MLAERSITSRIDRVKKVKKQMKYCRGYPEDLDLRGALKLLLASCSRLQFEMGGTGVVKTGMLDKWDKRIPTIHYLERNMRWAKEVLDR